MTLPIGDPDARDQADRDQAAHDPAGYLGADEIVETTHPAVVALGERLRAEHAGDRDFARAAFEWVRDEVAHAYDAQDPRVTLSASEVLAARVGLCYAKSHLLAAVLRSQGVPTALCYQRLTTDEGHVLHGLVAVHLDGGWHRQDPRGNKSGVDAQFSLEEERLAWPVDESLGERDDPRLHVSPAPEMVAVLRSADNILTCALPTDLPAGLSAGLPD